MSKSPFDFWQRNGDLDFHSGDVRIYNLDRDQFLFVGQTMYASTRERPWYIRNVMPKAKGSVLEIGLGLGCASKVILTSSKVQKLLTIEKNEDVVAAFGRPLSRHLILLEDIYSWVDRLPKKMPMYDLIFVDHYTMSDEEEQLKDLQRLAVNLEPLVKREGNIVFWIDENAPDEFQGEVKRLWLSK